jgi:hypothetical protein
MQPWNNNNNQYGGYPPQGPPQGFGGPPMGGPPMGGPPMGSGYGSPPMGSGFGGPTPIIGVGGQNAGGVHPPYSQQGQENEVEGRGGYNGYYFLNKIFLVTATTTTTATGSINLNMVNLNMANSINLNMVNLNMANSINLNMVNLNMANRITTSHPKSLPVDQEEIEMITVTNLIRPTNM